MYKYFKFFLVFAGMALMGLQACSLEETAICPEEPGTGGQDVPIKFSTQAPVTRTTPDGNSWNTGDSVGIYMLADVSPYLPGNGIATNINANRRYELLATANPQNLAPAGSQNLYYQGSKLLRFIAYYPYNAAVSGYTLPIDVTDQSNPAFLDVLYSGSATGINEANPGVANPVKLTFNHILSKIIINVRIGPDTDVQLEGMKTAIEGVPVTAKFHLDSIWSDISAAGRVGFKPIPPTTANYDTAFQAILIPGPLPTDHKDAPVQIQTVRRLFNWKLPASLTAFEPGKVYTFNLTLIGETEVDFTASINPWTDEGLNQGPGGNPGENQIGSQNATGDSYKRIVGDGLDTLNVIYLRSDQFMMGSTTLPVMSSTLTAPVHQVEMTKGYHLMDAPVTNAQFCRFLNDTVNNHIVGTLTTAGPDVDVSHWITGALPVPIYKTLSGTNHGLVLDGKTWKPVAGKENFPMASVTWFGAQAYAKWAGGSLPTEAQWEYAARGGLDLQYDFINQSANGAGMATFAVAATTAPAPVRGTRTANGYNLYDMFGNVWEWCYDRVANTTEGYAITTDPNGSSTDVTAGTNGILRGGCYSSALNLLSIGNRNTQPVESLNATYGFRVAFTFQ